MMMVAMYNKTRWRIKRLERPLLDGIVTA